MKRILSFIVAAMFAGQAWAVATTFEVDGLLYTVTDETNQYVSVGKGSTNPTGALEIPSTVTNGNTTYTVTSIVYQAFNGCNDLTSITISKSVTLIGMQAFKSCIGLISVTIPESVTGIGNSAFYGCSSLTSITIPESVTVIGRYAFEGCISLSYNTYDNAKYLGNSKNPYVALINTTTKEITSCNINENCKAICNSAFNGCNGLTSITIPNSVTIIGDYEFENCIGLISITIPESVTSIGNFAFYGCSGLTFITIPNSVTSIGDNAFSNCSGLTTVTIPNSVTSIGRNAFYDCSRLTTITIPESITNIGSYAFYGCSGLTSICYEGRSQPTYQSNSFTNVAKTIPVCVPSDYASNRWCGFTNLIIGHNRVTDAAVAATCTETGLTEGSHCSYCGKIFVAQQEIDAVGHNYGAPTYEWANDGSACTATAVCQRNETHVATEDATITSEETIAATCVEMGTTTYTAAFENELFALQTKDVVDIPATGHTPDIIAFENQVPATCTTVGTYDSVVYCSVCKVEVSREEHAIPALGHTYNTTVTAPTCTVVGYTTHTCSVCEYTYNSDTVEAKGHKADSVEFENIIPATCTVAGSKDSVVFCSVCQAELSREEHVISALGHTYGTTITEPTCTEVGYTTHTCSVCEYTYNSDTVAATGHTYSSTATAPTCVEVGYTTHTCSVCDYAYYSDTVAATGHTEVTDAAVPVTCTEAGKTEGKHCSVCNETIVEQTEIPALGHEFKDYVYNNDATTAADGTETATCTRGCGATDTRPAAGTKLAETPEKGTAVAESAANAVTIYAHHNIIVVENATDEINVYDAMGKLICRDVACRVRTEITINGTGVYIVKTGATVKRVVVN